MDSGNSGSISSSGDEEYDSHVADDSLFLNHPLTHFNGGSSSQSQSHHNPSGMFDYVHSLPPKPHSMLNLDYAQLPSCTATLPPPPPPPPSSSGMSHSCSFMPGPNHQDNARLLLSPTNAAAPRNSKKRTRASRRAPTTVLTTDTTNFRSMVQEFTGIPAPPFSSSSSPYSRRFDLLPPTAASHHPNPFLPSSSPFINSRLIDAAVASSSSATANNFHLPPDLGLPYRHQPQDMNLRMQNHPILPFNPPPPVPAGFGARSQPTFPIMPSLDDVGQMNNAHLLANTAGVSVSLQQRTVDQSVANSEEGMASDGSRRRDLDPFRSLDANKVGGGTCKLNFSAAARIDHHLEP